MYNSIKYKDFFSRIHVQCDKHAHHVMDVAVHIKILLNGKVMKRMYSSLKIIIQRILSHQWQILMKNIILRNSKSLDLLMQYEQSLRRPGGLACVLQLPNEL